MVPISTNDDEVTLPFQLFDVDWQHQEEGQGTSHYLIFTVCRDDIRPRRRGRNSAPMEAPISKAKKALLGRRLAKKDAADGMKNE